jgi:hypothetical protein
MDAEFKERFLKYWNEYFPGAELPIGFYYSMWRNQNLWLNHLKDIVASLEI